MVCVVIKIGGMRVHVERSNYLPLAITAVRVFPHVCVLCRRVALCWVGNFGSDFPSKKYDDIQSHMDALQRL